MDDGSLIEIKGYETNKDKEKYKSVDITLNILYKKDLKNIIQYVIDKYGKDYIRLYEN